MRILFKNTKTVEICGVGNVAAPRCEKTAAASANRARRHAARGENFMYYILFDKTYPPPAGSNLVSVVAQNNSLPALRLVKSFDKQALGVLDCLGLQLKLVEPHSVTDQAVFS